MAEKAAIEAAQLEVPITAVPSACAFCLCPRRRCCSRLRKPDPPCPALQPEPNSS